MFGWQMLVKMALPMIEMAAQSYINKDDNETGKDDMIGQSLHYAYKILTAVIDGKDIPKAPKELQ